MRASIIEQIGRLFRERGDGAYFGEAVTQTEHALQSAALAEQDGASSTLITAALLHDIGHLLHHLGENYLDAQLDDRHEELGRRFLLKHFGPEVSEPVRLHVPAKRYLCATESGYLRALSPTSIQSLELQGGAYSPEEAAAFQALPHFETAIAVRRWDDAAKIPGAKTPDLEHFLSIVQKLVRL